MSVLDCIQKVRASTKGSAADREHVLKSVEEWVDKNHRLFDTAQQRHAAAVEDLLKQNTTRRAAILDQALTDRPELAKRYELTKPKPPPPVEVKPPAPVEAPPVTTEAVDAGATKTVAGEPPVDIKRAERVGPDDPFVSRIANRFTKERSAQGEIGEIAPGVGYATSDLIHKGLRMGPEKVAQHISDLMQNKGGNRIEQAAAVRAEEARLSDRSIELSRAAEANPRDVAAREAAHEAFSHLTDFHQGPIAKLKNEWHAQGMAMQGEIPVDLSTFNGLREQWLRKTGKAPTAAMEPALRRTARNVTRALSEEAIARENLGREIERVIERVTKNRKLPTAEEVRNSLIERMKDEPCRV